MCKEIDNSSTGLNLREAEEISIEDLEAAADMFDRLKKEAHVVVDPVAKKAGVTQEELEVIFNELGEI